MAHNSKHGFGTSLTRHEFLAKSAFFGMAAVCGSKALKIQNALADEEGSLISALIGDRLLSQKQVVDKDSEFSGIPNSKLPLSSQRYAVITDEAGGYGAQHLIWIDNGSITACETSLINTQYTYYASYLGSIAFKYEPVASERSNLFIIQNGEEIPVASNTSWFFPVTANDSYLVYFEYAQDGTLDATLYSILERKPVLTIQSLYGLAMSPQGKKFYYIDYENNNELMCYDTATNELSHIDYEVQAVLLAADDGRLLYRIHDEAAKTSSNYDVVYYDGQSRFVVHLNREPFPFGTINNAKEFEEQAIYSSEGSELFKRNAGDTELLYQTGSYLEGDWRTYVYVLGEEKPRILAFSWYGNWDEANTYETFLDNQLLTEDEYSHDITLSLISALMNNTTADAWPVWTDDNHWLFTREEDGVVRHELGNLSSNEMIYMGSDVDTIVLAGCSSEPYILLQDGTLSRRNDGTNMVIAQEVTNTLWIPMLEKLAFTTENGNLYLTSPLDNSIKRIAKSIDFMELQSGILVYKTKDNQLFAVDITGSSVEI
ncbi:MAG: hypothetical protein IKE43_09755 [Coriobacteriales bacterium]|nr:hypothetical protein [Coriobacteriales bacterium]